MTSRDGPAGRGYRRRPMSERSFTLLSTSDTDLLSARSSGAEWRLGNPSRLDDAGIAALADGSEVVVVRILGVRRQYEEMLAPLLTGPAPVVVLGGEQVPDAELMELSTVPMGVATEAHGYLAQGGPDNLVQLHRFLSDTVLLTGEGFEPVSVAPGLIAFTVIPLCPTSAARVRVNASMAPLVAT